MTRLDDYRSALLAAFPECGSEELAAAVDAAGPDFASFVIDHGLGPLWHERTRLAVFRKSRVSAEALYLAQEHALAEIDAWLGDAAIEYVLIKGAANRLLLYDNPALRACYDFDLLVRPEDRVRTAALLSDHGYVGHPAAHRICVELVLSRDAVDIDLHWRLLREGRLREECTQGMLDRRRRCANTWMLCAEDTLFVLLVHSAFAKHVAGWEMGLHRVADIIAWLRTQAFDWSALRDRLERNGVRTAAWATLRWVQMLSHPHSLALLDTMVLDLQPGRLRRRWLEWWLQGDLSARLVSVHWGRLLGFSLFLHDTPRDAARAVAGRFRSGSRREADLEVFRELWRE